jgi:hypothetical protein
MQKVRKVKQIMKIDTKQLQQFDPTRTLTRMAHLAELRIGSRPKEWLRASTFAWIKMTDGCVENYRAGLGLQTGHWPAVTGIIDWVPESGWMHRVHEPLERDSEGLLKPREPKDCRHWRVDWKFVKVEMIMLSVGTAKAHDEYEGMSLLIIDNSNNPKLRVKLEDVCGVHLRRMRRATEREESEEHVNDCREDGNYRFMSDDAKMDVEILNLPAVLEWMFEFGSKAAAKMAAEKQSLAKQVWESNPKPTKKLDHGMCCGQKLRINEDGFRICPVCRAVFGRDGRHWAPQPDGTVILPATNPHLVPLAPRE